MITRSAGPLTGYGPHPEIAKSTNITVLAQMRNCILFIVKITCTATARQTVITNDASHVKRLLCFVQNVYFIPIPSFVEWMV
jgi:hypothetical protein